MFRTYLDVAVLAAKRAARSWLAGLGIPALAGIIMIAAGLVAPLGMVGGIVLALIIDACVAIYLSMLRSAVAGSKLQLADFKNGLSAFWDVVSVMFALWIINLGVQFIS